MERSLRGSGHLAKFIVRRDVFRLLLWLVSISAVTFSVPPAFRKLYPIQEQRDILAETMRNPAMTAMVGPGNLDSYTLGAMMSHQMLLLTAVAVALMNILLAIRFTRAEEETGITEMIQSLSIGRRSPLIAAMSVLVGINIMLAIIIWAGLVMLKMESGGALLYGLTLGGIGIFFSGIAIVCAQLSESARGATSLSMVVLAISYIIRSAGDVSESVLSRFSPLGWVTFVQPFSANNGWPIVCCMIGGILLGWLAWILQGRRDLGAGFIHPKSGRTHASRYLSTPFALTLRLQRTGMIIWAVGMLVLGISYGSVLGDLESFFDGNELLKNMLAGNTDQSVAEQFLPLLMLVMALIATIPSVLAMHKLAGEEKVDRIDSVLGRSVSRTHLMRAYMSVAALNGIMMNTLAALGLWLASVSVMDNPLSATLVFLSSAVQIPAILVMVGLSAMGVGIAPKWSSLVWLYLVYSFVTLYLGSLFQFPEWATRTSPFGWVPEWPVESMNWIAIVSLGMIAAVFAIIGMIGYHKRDI